MLSDAIGEIRRAAEESARQRQQVFLRRRPLQLLDRWVGEMECLLLQSDRAVPRKLIKEIDVFVEPIDRGLGQQLRGSRGRDPSRVLDVLFAVQERFLATESEEL